MSPDAMIAILVLLIGAVVLWANSIQNLLKDQIKMNERRCYDLLSLCATLEKRIDELEKK